MLANFKNRVFAVIAPDLPTLPSAADFRHNNNLSTHALRLAQPHMQDKFAYARPPFLQLLTQDELRASADHNVRPIIVPRDISLLPWGTGYAECVNSGKSEWNEDQAAFCRQVLSDPTHKFPDLPYTYFGIFDGHAGYGAALAASHQFHYILHEKLVDCIEVLLPRDDEQSIAQQTNGFPHPSAFQRRVSKDELIVGALESAFFHMDSLLAQDRDRYRDAGGCTACVSLFINGKLYVANAGDSRAVLCQRKSDNGAYAVPFSHDHTPETERQRLLNLALLKPNLVGKHYAAMEYAKRPHAKDLGQRILCRQGVMKGWTYKTLTHDDLRAPVVSGEGKRSRLLGTLGVTRGFGDHDLLAIFTGTQLKPFLTPHPDVLSRELSTIVSIPDEHNEDGDYGVLVMATDGLWDVSENEAVARTVFTTLAKFPTEKHRYTMAAQELVAKARGKINDSGHWRLADSKAAATVDDISVIVIPVYQYYKEHMEWEQKCAREYQQRIDRDAAIEAKEVEAITKAQVEQELAVVVEEEQQQQQEDEVIDNESVRQLANENGAAAAKESTPDALDEQINAAVSALEAAQISVTTTPATTTTTKDCTSPAKTAAATVANAAHTNKVNNNNNNNNNKTKHTQQQQKQSQRNRKDNKQ